MRDKNNTSMANNKDQEKENKNGPKDGERGSDRLTITLDYKEYSEEYLKDYK